MESEWTLVFWFDAFSSREPLPTSLENALANPPDRESQPLAMAAENL